MSIGYIITDCARGIIEVPFQRPAFISRRSPRPAANNLQYSLRSTRKFMRAPGRVVDAAAANLQSYEARGRKKSAEKNTFLIRAPEQSPRSLIFHYPLFIARQLPRHVPATCPGLFDHFSDNNCPPFLSFSRFHHLIQIVEIILSHKPCLKSATMFKIFHLFSFEIFSEINS